MEKSLASGHRAKTRNRGGEGKRNEKNRGGQTGGPNGGFFPTKKKEERKTAG